VGRADQPGPRGAFDRLLRIKYVRTLVTQLWYWPLLLRELGALTSSMRSRRRMPRSSWRPFPPLSSRSCLVKPVVLNYHSGEAPDHLRRSAIARG